MKLIVLLGSTPSAEAPDKVPMSVGDAKLPAASDSCTVKTFPALKVPVEVNATNEFYDSNASETVATNVQN